MYVYMMRWSCVIDFYKKKNCLRFLTVAIHAYIDMQIKIEEIFSEDGWLCAYWPF